jgi:hypothetical protein
MERRRCYVFAVLVAGAVGVFASGCGTKKDENSTAMGADAPAATLSAADTPPPVLNVPPPLPTPAAVPAATPTPTAAKTAEPKADPEAEAKAVTACCAALRTEAGTAKGGDKAKYQRAASSCNQLSKLVGTGGSTKDRALGSTRAAISGLTVPGACKLRRPSAAHA